MVEGQILHRKPIKDEIFEILHARIIAGQYAAGEWLRQEDISSQLGVSMTPVREALDLLVSAGLAERVPYRGVRVLEPSNRQILDSYGMRLLLESSAVFAAAHKATPIQVTQMRQILDQTHPPFQLHDMSRQRVLSRELHTAIVAAAGNSQLLKIYNTVLNAFPDWMLYEYLFRHPELLDASMENEYREHTAIVEAVAHHRPELAVQRTLDHILNRGKELETYLGITRDLIQATESEILALLVHGRLPQQLFEQESI